MVPESHLSIVDDSLNIKNKRNNIAIGQKHIQSKINKKKFASPPQTQYIMLSHYICPTQNYQVQHFIILPRLNTP